MRLNRNLMVKLFKMRLRLPYFLGCSTHVGADGAGGLVMVLLLSTTVIFYLLQVFDGALILVLVCQAVVVVAFASVATL